jgi:hypothetical protein
MNMPVFSSTFRRKKVELLSSLRRQHQRQRLIKYFFSKIMSDMKYLFKPPLPEGGGGILFYICPSFRSSKIFFVAFFSVKKSRAIVVTPPSASASATGSINLLVRVHFSNTIKGIHFRGGPRISS